MSRATDNNMMHSALKKTKQENAKDSDDTTPIKKNWMLASTKQKTDPVQA